jgi:TolB-like protein/DNA-binding SARP family transcriptional activator/Tfp pilus assembly protein PilF
VESNVEAGVEIDLHLPVEPGRSKAASDAPGVHLRLLGPLTISRGGHVVALPASRKARALLAYLALSPRAVGRAQLCELLWDLPNDPRGELRWCLSKIRGVLDDPDRRRVQTSDDSVSLDLDGCFVDAIDVENAMQLGIDRLDAPRLQALSELFLGEFLDGLEVARSPTFNGWLLAQRRRYRGGRIAMLEHLVAMLPPGAEESFGHLQVWLALAPFDQRAHGLLFRALGQRSQIREGDEHLAATVRLFEAEGLDWRPLGNAWRAAKGRLAKDWPSEPAAVSTPDSVQPIWTPDVAEAGKAGARRASIAVMPFVDEPTQGAAGGSLANGLTHDIITRLSKLRSLFVIAQGTVFVLGERSVGPHEAARTLNVDYVVSGSVQRRGGRVVVNVELTKARTAHILWAEAFDQMLDDAFFVLDEIGTGIVSAIDSEVELAERNRAILKAPNSLDAWEAHHRGLWHMYRFNEADNAKARHFFEMALRLDPGYSRAHAGLSFTFWQSAFQRWGERQSSMDRAYEAAGQSLMADERDPAAHWAMGRALWLRGQQAQSQSQSLLELNTAVDLSPSFAQGHYTLAFVHCQSGDPKRAIESADHSRHLSPYDPLLFGMFGARALGLIRLGEFEEGAEWAVKAAKRPNAHVHILVIAALCLALVGRHAEAQTYLAAVHRQVAGFRVDDFLAAFHFTPDAQALFRRSAKTIGID